MVTTSTQDSGQPERSYSQGDTQDISENYPRARRTSGTLSDPQPSASVPTESSRGLLSNSKSRSYNFTLTHWLSRNIRNAVLLGAGAIVICTIFLILYPASRTTSTKDPDSASTNEATSLHVTERGVPCTTWPIKENNGSISLDPPATVKGSKAPIEDQYAVSDYRKPEGLRIVGIVFYGRREYVDILECYLKQNLVSNGGFLDEVVFLVNTKDSQDIAFVDSLVRRSNLYKIRRASSKCRAKPKRYGCLWEQFSEPDALYVKIDDDILYVHPKAVSQLVQARLENPKAIAIGSTLVNSHLLSWPVYHHGAIYPYLPEPVDSNGSEAVVTWRPSELPPYPQDLVPKFDDVKSGKGPKAFAFKPRVPQYEGQRWLPLPREEALMLSTPMYEIEHSDLHISVTSWMVAAQQHYSFFENLENGSLGKYDVGDANGIWNPMFRRYNINFMAVWGSDVQEHSPVPMDDERYFTMVLPQKTGRPFLVASRSLVSHFHFQPQAIGLRRTDLLDRYRAYANEFICPAEAPRMPFGARCSRFSAG